MWKCMFASIEIVRLIKWWLKWRPTLIQKTKNNFTLFLPQKSDFFSLASFASGAYVEFGWWTRHKEIEIDKLPILLLIVLFLLFECFFFSQQIEKKKNVNTINTKNVVTLLLQFPFLQGEQFLKLLFSIQFHTACVFFFIWSSSSFLSASRSVSNGFKLYMKIVEIIIFDEQKISWLEWAFRSLPLYFYMSVPAWILRKCDMRTVNGGRKN